nr:MAG TPA: hypothetical protein [Caudoviricetes sp.]
MRKQLNKTLFLHYDLIQLGVLQYCYSIQMKYKNLIL